MSHLSYTEIIREYPPVGNEKLRGEISTILQENNIRIVVLDDDPTGIQTVQGNYLLTNWNAENVTAALSDEIPFFYLLTNTRAMTAIDAETTVREAMNAVLDSNRDFGYKLVFVSRSDSTLRGHFPLESEVIREEIEKRSIPISLPTVFTPAFFEAGRYTLGGIHYMKDGDALVPVSETEFARDNVFGYTHSDLAGYIEEKSAGRIPPNDIQLIGLEEWRNLPIETLESKISESAGKTYITLDALDYNDLRKFAISLLHLVAKNDGYTVLRTSSSMPKALTGIADQPLLDRHSLKSEQSGGLFIVGSHVKKTTAQLSQLLETPGVQGVEIDIHEVLRDPVKLLDKTEEILSEIHTHGKTPVVYTSRQELRLDDATERQRVGQQISDFLVEIVKKLRFQPAWLVAKGGITSHDILTEGLGIERARVLGQALPGVPAILTDKGMPYIIFPGNVGSEDALKEIYERLG